MVHRSPSPAEQVAAGRRLGGVIRAARGDRDPRRIAVAAGISPGETLRKIESGRMPSPGFGTIVGLCDALDLPLAEAVDAWRGAVADQSIA